MSEKVSCILDTNVVFELMHLEPAPTVSAWVAERDAEEMYLTAVTESALRSYRRADAATR